MYFSRISLSPHADVQQVARQVCQDAYREHQFLWRLFEEDPNAERDFLFRRDTTATRPRFFLLSQRQPRQMDSLWLAESKPFEPSLRNGQQLVFSLRANAVVTRRDEEGRQVRHDVVMDMKRRLGFKDMPPSGRPALPALIHQAGLEWLQRRAERNGFSVSSDAVRIEGYQQHQVSKKGGKQPIRYSTLDFTGLLTIDDASVFRKTLLTGVGPAKAFGCGLLLVRRI